MYDPGVRDETSSRPWDDVHIPKNFMNCIQVYIYVYIHIKFNLTFV